MTKIFRYLLQSIIIYFFFVIGRLLGIKLSRQIFSLIFSKVAPLFKSKRIIEQNLYTVFSGTDGKNRANILRKDDQMIFRSAYPKYF